MLIFAHRGYHADVPENTLEAFRRAEDLGVDGIETDVRMSADGLAILFHDRLSPDGRDVADLSRSDLSELVGYSVPTLESALERSPGVIWNLEIKVPEAIDATVEVVSRLSGSHRFLITSFWHPVVARVAALVPVECGPLIAHCPHSLQFALDLRTESSRINTLVWHVGTADDLGIRTASGLGFRNLVYGMATRSDHDRLLGLDIVGAITDDPGLLLGRRTKG